MKKIFSFVLLTGMLTLMSFGSSLSAKNQIDKPDDKVINCWGLANSQADLAMEGGATYDEAMNTFDAVYDDCSRLLYGLSGSDCIGC